MDCELNRKDVDDYNRRNKNKNSYKNRQFSGKRSTIDEYSGNTVYYSRMKNKKTDKYHFSTEKAAQVDHVKPVDQIIKKYDKKVKSGKLTKEQLKELANSDYNLKITSQRLNASKQQLSNHEYLYRQLKKGNSENFNTAFNMIQTELAAEVATAYKATGYELKNQLNKVKNSKKKTKKQTKSAKKTPAKNMEQTDGKFIKNSTSAVASGTSAAFMSCTVSTVTNIVLVASGDKSVKQAAKDIALDTGGSFASAAAVDLLQSCAKEFASIMSGGALKNVLMKDLPIQQISTAVMIGSSVIKYINDDITAEECVTEIILNGLGALAYSIGMVIGGPAEAIISTIVMGQISKCVLEYQQKNKMQREKDEKLISVTSAALVEMEKQRRKLQELIDERNKEFKTNVDDGFKQIFMSAFDNDTEGISDGLNIILSTLGKTTAFANLKKFDEFFYDNYSEFTF